MYRKKDPIGVIDSGIGGFSVVKQVQRELPGEDIVYFGDGANVPYGNHSRAEIVTMTRYILEYMKSRNVKALLTACNTISCVIDEVAGMMTCPMFNIVRAGAEAVAALDVEKVGVISTVFTHSTGCYAREIGARSPRKVEVISHGCPNLANLVEHSLNHPERMGQVEEDLGRELDALDRQGDIQALVLGCTHYPLVEGSIQKLRPGLPLLDPAVEMAREVRAYLEDEDLLDITRSAGWVEIMTTGSVEDYTVQAAQIGLERVKSVSGYPPMKLP